MAKKRGNNEGSITQRKNGLWQAAITTGYNKRSYFYGKTRKEASEKLTAALNDAQKGIFVEPTKVTVGEWMDTWLNDYAKSRVRPSTWDSYEYLVRVHVKPSLGGLVLRKLQPSNLQRLYNEKLASGRLDGQGSLSDRTVRLIHIVIHSALKQAVKEGILYRNVSEATSLPTRQKKEMRVLTKEEMQLFLECAQKERLYPAFLLLLGAGLREGELLGLRWQDVNLHEGVIRVTQALTRIRNQEGPVKTKLVFQEPKTKSGKRSIPLPTNVAFELKAHKVRQAQEKLLAGEEFKDNGLVFCTETGTPLEPRNFTRKFHALITESGIPHANLHSLRHTYATRLLEMNEHPKVVQELLGHASINLTLDIYSHVMPEIKQAAATKLNDVLPAIKRSDAK